MEKRTDSWSLRLANLVHTRLGANYTGPAYLSGPSLLPAWSLQTAMARPHFPASYSVNQGEFRSQQPRAKMKLEYKVLLNNSRMGLF